MKLQRINRSSGLVTALLLLGLVACQQKPVVIEAQNKSGNTPPAAGTVTQNTHNEMHTVTINEVLQATKYTYLNVNENGEDFWIAVPRREVDASATYQYSGGLKKVNFKSQEFDRTFPLVYLVGGITEVSGGGSAIDQAYSNLQKKSEPDAQVESSEGSVKLSELFANREKFAGKKVQVTGKCVKTNNAIMGRNWVHIQDGTSQNGENYDLTVTTHQTVNVGSTVTMEGLIVLNKDFGAGYKYDIIMEEAHLH